MNGSVKPEPGTGAQSAFLDAEAYARWRDAKLHDYPACVGDLLVEVADPRVLTQAERGELLRRCRKANMAVYASALGDSADKDIPRRLGEQFGLRRLDPNMLADDDGITSLTVVPGKLRRGYIPYSDRRLLWHTDGYYNAPEQSIRAFILHCAHPAAEGGENALFDPDIAYILLRERDPDYIRVLSRPDAMTIPANTESGAETRPACSGPVFSLDSASGGLHMRYTARTRSIEWLPDASEAVRALEGILADAESPYLFRHRLDAGQGLLANNVLHNRTAFRDEADAAGKRLIYRARYYDRIDGTSLADPTSASR